MLNLTFLTVGSAARRIGVTSQTIRNWERLGKLRALRTETGVRLFLATDVEALAREREA